MANNHYSKHSSRADIQRYWDYHNNREKNIAVASDVGGKVANFMVQDYLDTKKNPPKVAKNIVSTASNVHPKLNSPQFAGQPTESGLMGFVKNPSWAGLETGVANTLTNPITNLGGMATKAGFAKTGGLITGAGTALKGALTSMGPVGWALLAGGALMRHQGKGGGRNKRRY